MNIDWTVTIGSLITFLTLIVGFWYANFKANKDRAWFREDNRLRAEELAKTVAKEAAVSAAKATADSIAGAVQASADAVKVTAETNAAVAAIALKLDQGEIK